MTSIKIIDTNVSTLLSSDNYNLTTDSTELVFDFTLCVLCGLLLITCWNLHFVS